MIKRILPSLCLLPLVVSYPVSALEKGDKVARIGVTHLTVDTSSGTLDVVGPPTTPFPGTEVGASDETGLTGTIGYMVTDKLEMELALGLPFEHGVKPNAALSATLASQSLDGNADLGTTKQIPPIVSVNYHFKPEGKIKPYVGLGLNYTKFFDEEVKGGLEQAGYTTLSIDDSFGLAAQAGVDVDMGNGWFVNALVRHVDVGTEAKISGGAFGDLQVKDIDINITAFSINVGKVF
jgi:outer membrane protein